MREIVILVVNVETNYYTEKSQWQHNGTKDNNMVKTMVCKEKEIGAANKTRRENNNKNN